MPAVSFEALQGLSKYRYNAEDTSPLAVYVMHPLWNHFVQYMPKWLAPNVMTVAGFVLLSLNVAMLAYYDYDMQAAVSSSNNTHAVIPSCVWLAAAVFQWAAHWLDGMDGKQARRTGSSTPLGELMDHGLDSANTMLIFIAMVQMFGITHDMWFTFVLSIGIMGSFYLSHWEKYNTGKLFLPWAYDISQVLITICFVVTSFKHLSFWQVSFELPVPVPFFGSSLSLIWCFVLLASGFIIVQPIQCLANIVTCESPKCSFVHGLTPLVPFLSMTGLFALLLHHFPSVYSSDRRLFFLAMAVCFAHMSCRLIVDQMTAQRFSPFPSMVLLLPIAIAILFKLSPSALVPSIDSHVAMLSFFFIALAYHSYYCVGVVYDICAHMDIYPFSIMSRPSQDRKNE